MKLTDMFLRNLKPQAQRYMVWADNGLGVRVSPKGKKSFVYMYRHEGKARFLTLGDYPRMTLADAHKAHAEAMKKVEQGIDPGAEALAERAEERQSPPWLSWPMNTWRSGPSPGNDPGGKMSAS